uniref:Uncharacterized protein n=2 Tax=Haptolina ericina TaxID=156174 RepID=A0A7S3EYU1_9EUKA|mmetsp:Transcript_38264/g.86871  ORF Transcript_38264/g.86871 Transcript_38264/m.86871 type:complete len:352 (+) Transcript_38264:532-1587(+)
MYMRVSVRQSDLCVSAIGIADCVPSCMFLGFSVFLMVFPPEPASPAAPCALHRCGFPVGTLMRLDVVPRLGALHIGNAPATATVSACKALTAGIILVLLSCDWSQPAVCELVPPHTAPPAHLGKPSSISKPFFSSHSSPQGLPADFYTLSRPEIFLQVCATGVSGGHTVSSPPGAYGWEYVSWRPPAPQTTPTTPLQPCTHAFPSHCMCTLQCTANSALHTTARAVFPDLFVEFGTDGPQLVYWTQPRRDIRQFYPFTPPSSPPTKTTLCAFLGSTDFNIFLKYDGSTTGHPFNFLSSPHQAPPRSASHQSLTLITAHASQHQHSSLSMPGTPHTYSHLVMPSHAYYTSIC